MSYNICYYKEKFNLKEIIDKGGNIVPAKPRIAFNKWNSPSAIDIKRIMDEGIDVQFYDGLVETIKK